MKDLSSLREDYRRGALEEASAPADPWELFAGWFDDASELDEPNAVVVSTVDGQGRPHSRTVLLKELRADDADPRVRRPVFYTNYASAKSVDLDAHPACALLFLWLPLERQVRIEGHASRVPAAVSDAYFAERPRGSQLGAWASPQSEPVADRAALEEAYAAAERRFEGRDVPRPEHWGGWQVEVDRLEYWQGRSGRLHDRLVYERAGDGWTRIRLAP